MLQLNAQLSLTPDSKARKDGFSFMNQPDDEQNWQAARRPTAGMN
jgi:hypothetical protein